MTVWYSGAPFGGIVAGLLTYRIVSLWLFMPFALGRLRTVRAMGRPIPHAEGTANPQGEPALPATTSDRPHLECGQLSHERHLHRIDHEGAGLSKPPTC